MGMFDSAMLKVKCPYCGKEDELECQKKEFSCILRVWKKGDYVDDSVKSFDAITECLSQECKGKPDSKTHSGEPYMNRFFYVRVFLKRGKIKGKYEIIDGY